MKVLLSPVVYDLDFLQKVQERKGDIRARHVNDTVIEAVQAWMKKK